MGIFYICKLINFLFESHRQPFWGLKKIGMWEGGYNLVGWESQKSLGTLLLYKVAVPIRVLKSFLKNMLSYTHPL